MAEERGEQPTIDWASARVEDGELRVQLAGELPKGFGTRVQEVLARLGGDAERRWGRVKVVKGEIRVRDPREGAEQDLRHELESAMLQASADLAPQEEDAEDEGGPEQQRDERMAAAFRAFADSGSVGRGESRAGHGP